MATTSSPSPPTKTNTKTESRPIRVAQLTSVHELWDTRIFHRICRSLKDAGYEVSLVGPENIDDENRGGVQILSVPRHSSRLRRFAQTVPSVFHRAWKANAEVYHLHDPELLPVGILLKLFRRNVHVVYDVHEDYGRRVLSKEWLPGPARAPLKFGVRLCERAAASVLDRIVAATPDIASMFPVNKTALVQNFPVAQELVPRDPVPYQQRPVRGVYVGSISGERGHFKMIEAFGLVPKSYGLRFDLIGRLPDPLRAASELTPGWDCVDEAGRLDRPEVCDIFGRSRFGLIVTKPTEEYVAGYPTKMFEYMSAGLPVISSDFPIVREIIDRTKCGICVDSKDPQSIANAMQWLLDHPQEAELMGQRGREAVLAEYSWEKQEPRLLDMYGAMTSEAA